MGRQGHDRLPARQAGLTLRGVVLAASLLGLAAAACDGPATPAPAPPVKAAPRPPRVQPPGHARILALLAEIRDRAPDENIYQCDGKVRSLEKELAALPAGAAAQRRFRLLFDLGDLVVLLGREREGIALLQRAYDLRPAVRGVVPQMVLDELVLRLGAAWVRVGETENCCTSNAPGACILPIAGEARHSRPEGSTKAIAFFTELCDSPDAAVFAKMQATWLLNVAAMTIGEYPDGVPAAHRIPPAYFAADEEFPHFPNVAAKLGLDTFSLAGGVVADDFDEDGDIDLLVSDFDPAGQLRYFRNDLGSAATSRTRPTTDAPSASGGANEGDGTFKDVTAAAGLTGLLGGLNLIQADYDNDGHVDVLVLRGGWLGKSGRHPKSLLHNNGDGTFTDVTFDAGLGAATFPSQTAVWFDSDNDGDLDLYIGNESAQGVEAPCQLWRNDGGTFTEIAAAAGVTNGGFTKGVVAGDFDGDGFPDLYVSNLGQANRLYMNQRNGTFADVAAERGVAAPKNGFPAMAFDFDDDGNLDILALPFYVTIADLAAEAVGLARACDTPHLYRGDGHGHFEDVSVKCRVDKPCSPMGCNFGDLDNDGFPDVYLGTGTPTTRAIMPNLVWHNRGGHDFADVTLPSGMGHLQKGHGVAFADFDGDGDLDVFEEMGGAYRGDKFRDALYENPGNGDHWIEVRCIGTKSNRSAIGARIRAEVVENGARRSVFATVGSGGSFGANPLRQHLGLGKAARIETLDVFWPVTGKTQTFRDVEADRVVEVTEGSDRLVTREPVRTKLGGR